MNKTIKGFYCKIWSILFSLILFEKLRIFVLSYCVLSDIVYNTFKILTISTQAYSCNTNILILSLSF